MAGSRTPSTKTTRPPATTGRSGVEPMSASGPGSDLNGQAAASPPPRRPPRPRRGRRSRSAPRPWLDLSTGVNPAALAGAAAAPRTSPRLPDPEEVAPLGSRRRPGLRRGAWSASWPSPGAEAASRALPAAHRRGQRGHRHAHLWRPPRGLAAGGDRAGPGDRAAAMRRPRRWSWSIRTIPTAALRSGDPALRPPSQGADGGWLVVDEAFVETAPRAQRRRRRRRDRAWSSCARSASSTAWPGVRLGFILAEPGFAARARAGFGDWPVSAEAIAAGTGGLCRHRLARAPPRERLAASAARLDGLLQAGRLRDRRRDLAVPPDPQPRRARARFESSPPKACSPARFPMSRPGSGSACRRERLAQAQVSPGGLADDRRRHQEPRTRRGHEGAEGRARRADGHQDPRRTGPAAGPHRRRQGQVHRRLRHGRPGASAGT